MTGSRTDAFKARLAGGEPLVGTWIKTPSPTVAEVLGRTALDVLCLDAEHAPFDRGDLDRAIVAARAGDMPVLVRLASAEAHHALNALDLGAAGVVAPHIASADDARALARACHFGPGGRGYAGSTRAAEFTRRPMADHLARSRAGTAVIAQIEDAAAVENIDAIAAVEGIDCLFIGRADLAVSLGAPSAAAPAVIEAARRVAEAGRRHGRAVGSFVGDLGEVRAWRERGVSFFLLESDQTFLLRGAAALVSAFEASAPAAGGC